MRSNETHIVATICPLGEGIVDEPEVTGAIHREREGEKVKSDATK